MTIEEVKEAIKDVLTAKTVEQRNQKIDFLLDGVPFDRNRIDEIESDIKELEMEAHHLDSRLSVEYIEDIMNKYGIKRN